MSLALTLFCLFCVLSAEGKPVVEEDPKCGYDACPKLGSDTLNVHLIPHSHDDVGWLKTPDQYYFQDVSNVISSVVDALRANPSRRFVQVETAFFKKWWSQQKPNVKQVVQNLVNNGQLEFINAAWTMNDEAATHYQSTIDQFTLGLRYIQDNLGVCARPKVAWQIDPFGHSREQASISSQLGFDSIFFARVDYRDKTRRLDSKNLDLLWRGSESLDNTDIFTSVLYNHYSAPSGFCYDIVCNDQIIIDDPESPDYNLEERVKSFANYVQAQASHYQTNNLLVTMGDDFRYEAAMTTYINLDRLIQGFEQFPQVVDNKTVKLIYSTPSCYTKAVNDFVQANNINLEIKTDDFFPYADGPNTYWTGYFTSRPASKYFERQGNNLLQVVKQLGAGNQEHYENPRIGQLKEAVGVMQHHDAITGTEKQHVANNYHYVLSKAVEGASDTAGEILSTMITGSDAGLSLKSCPLSNVSACVETQADHFTVVVYNPLSHNATTPIRLPIYGRTSWTIIDPEGNDVPYQIENSLTDFSYVTNVETSAQELLFSATDLPALGFKVYQFALNPKGEVNDEKPEPRVQVGYNGTSFEISEESGLLKSVTMNGVQVPLEQNFLFYNSRDTSGAYIFVPISGDANYISKGQPVTTTLVRGDVSQGVVQEFGTWAKQFIRIYKDDPTFIEFDWIIGPIDISNYQGKEVISRYTSLLLNDGTFYTDANGREIIKRQLNHRPDYTYTNEQPASGNYYPVNTQISIRDENVDLELAVITDRSEGGSSLHDGQIELMVHRACQQDDGRGVGENLNEQEYGSGIRVRGKHYLVVGREEGDGKRSMKTIQRELALRKNLQPWVFISGGDNSAILETLEFSGLRYELPENVRVLTLEPWGEKTVLVRFEHVFEKDDDDVLSREVAFGISDLFTLFTITEIEEMTLGANVPLEENQRLQWPGGSKRTEKPRDEVDDITIFLKPMEIRTFIAKVIYT